MITVGTATAALNYIKEFVYQIRYIIDDINEINGSKSIKRKYSNILLRTMEEKEFIRDIKSVQGKDILLQYEDFNVSIENINF